MKKPENHIFKKLKRKFILTASLSSAAVLLLAFSAIYLIVSQDTNHRPPFRKPGQSEATSSESITPDVSVPESITPNTADEPISQEPNHDEEFERRIRADRKKSLETLLISLIITGLSVEALVVLASFYFAEKSVKPVREAYEAQKDFIANASHEIKTPLAVIQANLEAADIKGNHWLDNAAKKAEELANLNNQLLALAQLDASSIPDSTKVEDVNLYDLVKETTDCYAPKIDKKHLSLKISGKTAKVVKLNRSALAQILNILIDNAIKYADTKIELKISENSEIQITNDGAIIKPNELEHVFDRFYQTDKTKSGIGLGLSIAKKLANKNSWKLVAASTNKTTTFTISML